VTKKTSDHAGAVTAVDAGFLDVLHDRADHGRFTVRNAIDIDLDRIFEKAVDQHGAIWRHFDCARHVATQIRFIVNELHRAAAKNERWLTSTG